MNKDEWVKLAAAKLRPYLPDNTVEYAEILYKTYVEDDDGYALDPEGAVAEDMSYWDED